MSLIVITWGGHVYTTATGGNAVEIWSCSMAAIGPLTPAVDQADCDNIAALISTYHNQLETHIHATAGLEWVKVNEYDVSTGHQVTDPTLVHLFATPIRGYSGSGSNAPALTTTCRVSLDDGTRNPSHRGGFYLPRFAAEIQFDGRFSTTTKTDVIYSTTTLIDGINSLSSQNLDVGVWSRKNHSIVKATRMRIGDVPDNIRTRRNNLLESYTIGPITT